MYSDDSAEYDYAVVGGVRRHICSKVCVGEYFFSFVYFVFVNVFSCD